ncbi:MAG: hypothetical protein ACE5G0_05480 [Rhodothermales bacterium]
MILEAFVLALLLLGCEEDVNPVLGTERAYSVYGTFNPLADTQAVRVFLIEDILAPTRPEPIDARVTSMDLQEGVQHLWQDSLIQFESSRYGHVYWAAFRAAFEHTYRLTVTRSDGAASQVEVTVPPFSKPELLAATVAQRFVFVPVLWHRAPRLNRIRVHYHTNFRTIIIDYPLDQVHVEAGAVVEIRLSDDARLIFEEAFIAGFPWRDLRLREIELRVLVTNEGWFPPTGVYNEDLLVEPGTFSNVENGFGFVGAGYPASFRWLPPDSVLTAAGFAVGE